jgi:hypothetical protein
MAGQLTQDRKTTAGAPQQAAEKKKLQQAAAVKGAFAHRNVQTTDGAKAPCFVLRGLLARLSGYAGARRRSLPWTARDLSPLLVAEAC